MVSETVVISGIIRIFITIILIFFIYIFLNTIIKRILLKNARTKKMKHNVIIFTGLIGYLVIFLGILFLILSFTGGLVSIGITAGLLTAALGWALQRPITGIAAWIMVIMTRPFEIGDRIVIGGVKGDVINITITHIYLSEFGGTIGGEEISGRFVVIPNSILFEQNIINYTAQDEYILDEVVFTVTHQSHLDLAKKIAKEAAEKVTGEIIQNVPMKPFTRTNFQPSGIDIRIRYYTIASKREDANSRITEEIFKKIMKEKKVEFAFPHTKVILGEKNKKIRTS